MIYSTLMLKDKYKNYNNINQKINLDVKNGKLIRIRRGLFTDDLKNDGPVIANFCYSPSYISFEYALSFYGMIPEHVVAYTSTCFEKKHNKEFVSSDFKFTYKHVPKDVYFIGIDAFKTKNGLTYRMACIEKALCDLLYIQEPVRSIKDLKILLYDDLRLDINIMKKMDLEGVGKLALMYHNNTLNVFAKYLKEELINEVND